MSADIDRSQSYIRCIQPDSTDLANACSLVNKTLICNDFIGSNVLDFLFGTDICTKQGDLTPFPEFVPPNFFIFNTALLTGRGGGLVTIV